MIWITPAGAFSCGADGITRGLLNEPRSCGCGRMTFFIVNRGGKSRCIDCDFEAVQRDERCANSLTLPL
jgi:hypothetical protein